MTDLCVTPDVLASIQAHLGDGRHTLEESGGSAPTAIDGGAVSALLSSMLATAMDNAATVSAALSVIDANVGHAGASFWEVDADQAAGYGAGRASLVD